MLLCEKEKERIICVVFRETYYTYISTLVSFSVYSYSKSHIYRLFFYLNSRECRFSDDGASRLCVSDTDSISNNCERLRSNIEITEVYLLLNSGKQIPFLQSYHCQRYIQMSLKTIANYLDFSSITKEVIWYDLNNFSTFSMVVVYKFLYYYKLHFFYPFL